MFGTRKIALTTADAARIVADLRNQKQVFENALLAPNLPEDRRLLYTVERDQRAYLIDVVTRTFS